MKEKLTFSELSGCLAPDAPDRGRTGGDVSTTLITVMCIPLPLRPSEVLPGCAVSTTRSGCCSGVACNR